MNYTKCLDQVNALYSYVKTHLQSEFEAAVGVEAMITDSKDKQYLLFDAFVTICYIINNSDYKDISSSFSIRDFPFGELMRELITLRDEWWKVNMRNEVKDPASIFPDCTELFTKCNTTFLQPSDIITDEIPSNAKVVMFDVKNCKNLIFNARSIIDDEYIRSNFGNINFTTGVNELILKRFHLMIDYELNKEVTTKDYIIDADPDKVPIYQKLDGKLYRQLKNNTNCHDSNYNLINYNMAVVNYENKVMLAMRQTIPKPPKAISHGAIIGHIKNNIYGKRMKVIDAIFDAYSNPNLSDNELLQILVSANMYQDKIPRGIKATEFDKYFNERDMASNIL